MTSKRFVLLLGAALLVALVAIGAGGCAPDWPAAPRQFSDRALSISRRAGSGSARAAPGFAVQREGGLGPGAVRIASLVVQELPRSQRAKMPSMPKATGTSRMPLATSASSATPAMCKRPIRPPRMKVWSSRWAM